MHGSIIFKLLSMILLGLASAFALCILAGLAMGEALTAPSIQSFFYCIVGTLVLSAGLHWLGRRGDRKFFRREALCAIGVTWILCTLIGAVPYYLIVDGCSLAAAIFEAASGLTTTGATNFSHFDQFPPSLLFWRSLSQWIGGLGVVVFFVALLSSLGAGAKILFTNESSATSADFDQGRIQSGALQLVLYYLLLSALCIAAYHLAGMSWFQAINHGMTTIATGGFSTESNSIEAFNSSSIEWICIGFMLLGGTTFFHAIRLIKGRPPGWKQWDEVITFYSLVIVAACAFAWIQLQNADPETALVPTLRSALFQSVSILTTTGYSSTDFNHWQLSAQLLLLGLMVIGGCSGSTSGGIKIIRIMIAVRSLIRSVSLAFRPNLTLPMRSGGTVLEAQAINAITTFILLMVSLQMLVALIVAMIEPNLSFMTLYSATQACLYNIGPGLDAVGPSQNYGFFSQMTKLLFALVMILGRLELYAVMVLFVPSFWKRYA